MLDKDEPKGLYDLDEDPLEFFDLMAVRDEVVKRLSREAATSPRVDRGRSAAAEEVNPL